MIDRRNLMSGGAGLFAATTLPMAARADGQVITMPFAMNGDRPVTTCFIGDKGPFLMLIDTGNAVLCSLREDLIEELNLRRIGGQRVYGATGTDIQIAYTAPDVVFGQAVRQKDVTFLALKTATASPAPKPPPGVAVRKPRHLFDGILPLALLTARPTDLDFTKGEMRLQYTGAVDRTGFRPLHSERVLQSSSAFIVSTLVDGVEARLIVDTGAGTTIALDPRFVARNGLWAKHSRYLETAFGGVTGGGGRSRLVRSPEVKIGPYLFKDVPINLADPRMTVLSERDGLLGIDFIRRFTAGFDAGASTLWLKPNDHLSDPFPYDRSGLTWEWKDGRAVVKTAAPGSPAEAAGIKAGDGLPQFRSEREAYAFGARLQGDPDTEIVVDVERDGRRIPVTMTLKDWL